MSVWSIAVINTVQICMCFSRNILNAVLYRTMMQILCSTSGNVFKIICQLQTSDRWHFQKIQHFIQ